MSPSSEPVRCPSCGAPLFDSYEDGNVVVDGEEIPFQRRTDFVACDNCGALNRVTDLVGSEGEEDVTSTEAHEALSVLRDLATDFPSESYDEA